MLSRYLQRVALKPPQTRDASAYFTPPHQLQQRTRWQSCDIIDACQGLTTSLYFPLLTLPRQLLILLGSPPPTLHLEAEFDTPVGASDRGEVRLHESLRSGCERRGQLSFKTEAYDVPAGTSDRRRSFQRGRE